MSVYRLFETLKAD